LFSPIYNLKTPSVENDQFQQSAKTADRGNVKINNDVPEVCETRVNGKQTRVPHKQMKVNVLRPLERIHSNEVMKGHRIIKYRRGIIM
jgi:hypothetical protein